MESKIKIFSTLIYSLIFSTSFVHAMGPDDTGNVYVRVAVLNNVKDLTLSIRGKYLIYDASTKREFIKGRHLRQTKVEPWQKGFQIGTNRFKNNHLRLETNKDITLYFDGHSRRYRGQVDLIRQKDNTFLVVNRIELEKYVRGVLYHEISHRWPMEAMKAQAVAARTYALFQAETNKDQPYDVTSDIYSQVYGGKSAERYRTNLAVKRTRGEILKFQNTILPAYFHANCGGHTENVKELWNHNLPPLRGREDPYCVHGPAHRWKKNFQSKLIQEQLNKNGYNLGLIKDIKVLDRNQSGRIKTLQITTRDGKAMDISGPKFRNIIGPNDVRSNKYEIRMQGYYFDLQGKGWGHGVGMCQWGAYAMSKKRFKYNEILNFYYPQTQLGPL